MNEGEGEEGYGVYKEEELEGGRLWEVELKNKEGKSMGVIMLIVGLVGLRLLITWGCMV